MLLAPSPKSLQSLIDICSRYAARYELAFNVKKTKVMCFNPKKLSTIHVPNFILNGKILDIVTTQKYLGVVINDQLTDDDDMY